jgi:hypothetical protein
VISNNLVPSAKFQTICMEVTVAVAPLELVISNEMEVPGFCRFVAVIFEQAANSVMVGVLVGVRVGVFVCVLVGVSVAVLVCVFVEVLVGVFVRVNVAVGAAGVLVRVDVAAEVPAIVTVAGEVGVRVRVGDGVAVRDGVEVRDGVSVREEVTDRVGVMVCEGVRVWEGVNEDVEVGRRIAVAVALGVTPNWASRVETASAGLTGVISCREQNSPVMVQATDNSSGESGSGSEGGLTAEVPSGPPRSMLVFSPATTNWL